MTYFRHSTVDVEPVLQLIRDGMPTDPDSRREKPEKVMINGVHVNVSSLRLRTFATYGTVCSACGLKAAFFALERDAGGERTNGSYHLNLYGSGDGEEVLFTHDHTVARSQGGANSLKNTTTMCTLCNYQKSIVEHSASALKHGQPLFGEGSEKNRLKRARQRANRLLRRDPRP